MVTDKKGRLILKIGTEAVDVVHSCFWDGAELRRSRCEKRRELDLGRQKELARKVNDNQKRTAAMMMGDFRGEKIN